MQDRKMTEIKSAGVSVIRRHILVAWHDKTRWRRNKEQTPRCFVYDTVNTYGVLYHYDIVHTNGVMPHWCKCEHGFKIHRIVAITALSLHALHQ